MIKLIKQSLLLAILLSGLVSFAQVGINTDDSNPDPSSMLDVKSNDKGMLIPRMTAAERDLIGTPATGLMVFVTDDNSFYFYDGSTWNLIGGSDDDWLFNGSEIYRSGNVGIGTNNPAFPVDIHGTGGERLRLFSQDTYWAGIIAKNNTREFFAGIQGPFDHSNATAGYHIFDNTAGAMRMVIDEVGNMGVGALNPTSKLDVRGNNIDDGVIISVGNSDESHKLALFGGRQNDPNPFIQWKDGDPMRFATDASGFTEHMRIDGNGNVGIGTSSPADKLHVKGNMRIDSARIEFVNTGGSVFIGQGAGANDDLSDNLNVAVGSYALSANTTGGYNVANGVFTLNSNTTGNNNTAIGGVALSSNTTGSENTAIGSSALFSNTAGNNNTASGYYALNANTTGVQNMANGANALSSNTTGISNVASGFYALKSNTTGNYNTASGSGALEFNTLGGQNTASGYGALRVNTTGYDNMASGSFALNSNTTGNYNSASGGSALGANTEGSFNTASGRSALISNITGSYNTAIGTNANVGSGNLTNATAIGAGAIVSQDSSLVLGNFANVGIGTSTPEEKLHVKGALKIVDGTEGMGKVLVSDSTGVTSWANLSDVINTSDTTQPITIQYHGSQIYVHPTDNAFDIDWATASSTCDALVAFTYDDWYLPTRLELDAIYKQSYLITGLSQTAFAKYWSSTEVDVSNAFSQRLDYGGPDPDAKTEAIGHNCRCIRKN